MKPISFVIIFLSMTACAWGAGSDIVFTEDPGFVQAYPSTIDGMRDSSLYVIKGTWTSDDATGAVSEALVTDNPLFMARAVGKILRGICTKPGDTTPTALYDITVTGSTSGYDYAGGELADRSATVTECVYPKYGNGYVSPDVWENPIVNITNAGNAKTGFFWLIFREYCR